MRWSQSRPSDPVNNPHRVEETVPQEEVRRTGTSHPVSSSTARERDLDRTDAHRDAHAHPDAHGATAPREVKQDDGTVLDSWIGDTRVQERPHVSWGAIFAGTVTFFAILVVLGVASAALGLGNASGAVIGIVAVVSLLVALAAAGFITGVLAVRGGLLHGLVTWATSLVGLLLLIGWLGSSILGAVGGAVGGVVQSAAEATNITSPDVGNAADNANVDQAQHNADQAAQDAQRTFEENRDEAAAGAWWGLAGLVGGAVVAGLAGAAGARSVHSRDRAVQTGPATRRWPPVISLFGPGAAPFNGAAPGPMCELRQAREATLPTHVC